MDQIRIIKEMRDECVKQIRMRGADVDRGCIRPRYMVWENVPGAFSSNGGEDFKAVLEETAKVADKDAVIPEPPGGKWTPTGCIVGDGWSIAWRVHDAQYFGVPQRRKRICLLADFNGDSAGKVLFELRRDTDGVYRKQIVMGFGEQSRPEVQSVAEGLPGDITESGKQGEGAAGATGSGTPSAGRSISFQERAEKPGGGNGQLHDAMSPSVEVSKTLNCMDDPAKIMVLNDQGGSQMNATEHHSVCYRKQGHPQNAEQGQGWEQTETNDTLNAFDSGEMRTPTVVVAVESHAQDARYNVSEINQPLSANMEHDPANGGLVMAIENHPADSRIKISEDNVFQTLSGRMGTGGNNVPMVMDAVCVGNGQVAQTRISETVGTLNCMHDQQAVMTYGLDRASFNQGQNAQFNFSIDEEKVGALVAKGPAGVYPCKSVVRRLTPMECERLQGYPDHWTDIGEWVDTKGKKHKDADSPRYKALGNSIALPFWMWLAEGIRTQYPDHNKTITMASLFDGISGFCLCFARAGIKPVWNSEIESFPEAVATKHFGDEERGIKGDYEQYL